MLHSGRGLLREEKRREEKNALLLQGIEEIFLDRLNQRFSNRVPRNRGVPQNIARVTERNTGINT